MLQRRTLVILVALLLLGCGGGGGAASTPSGGSLFSGTYSWAQLSGDNSPPGQVTGAWGVLEADGIETAQISVWSNEAGVISPPGSLQELRYGVGLDRTLAFRLEPFPFLDFVRGGVTSNGEVACGAVNLLGSTGVYMYVRHGPAPSLASLDGAYHVVGYSYSDALAVHTGWVGVVTFDGAGGATLSAGLNRNGTIAAYGPAAVSYAVAADGQVTLDLGNSITVTGRGTADGQLLIASGSTTPGGPPACFAFLRTATAATATDFDAFYHTVAFRRDMTTSEHFSGAGATIAQGDGNIAWLLYAKDESVQTMLESDTGTYSVLPNGTVVVTTAADSLRGAVSADGAYAILGRLAGPDPDPSFWLLLR